MTHMPNMTDCSEKDKVVQTLLNHIVTTNNYFNLETLEISSVVFPSTNLSTYQGYEVSNVES